MCWIKLKEVFYLYGDKDTEVMFQNVESEISFTAEAEIKSVDKLGNLGHTIRIIPSIIYILAQTNNLSVNM